MFDSRSIPSTLPETGPLLGAAFFDRAPDIVAPELLGAWLLSGVGGEPTGGRIVEVEAYLGSDDPGSHAATHGITKRNAVMYGPPGTAYVYFTYGNHHMVNLVCESVGVAGAVLIRAIEPLVGLDTMLARRAGRTAGELCNGPGKLAAALGVDLSDNGRVLGAARLAAYASAVARPVETCISGRVGLSRGHELALRWYVAGSPFVSRAKIGPVGKRRRPQDEEDAG